MTTQRTLGRFGGTVIAVIGLLVAVRANAVPPQAAFPTKALNYTAWLARAMDPCDPSTVSVISPGSPSSGCIQSNVTTDDDVSPGATMNFAKISVKRTGNHLGRVGIFGKGFHGGQRMKVQLTLRVTKAAQSTKHPMATNSVTYQDVTVQCGNNSVTGCFTANVRGNVAGSMTLVDCLLQNSQPTGLANGNVQIVDSALVNCDTLKIIATPGILN